MDIEDFLERLENDETFRPEFETSVADTPYAYLTDIIRGGWEFKPDDRMTCVEMLAALENNTHSMSCT